MISYLPIKNILFGKYTAPEDSIIYNIKSIGFYILSYLIYEAKGNDYLNTNKTFIGEYLSLDIRTVTKYLVFLQENNLISCIQNIQETKRNSLLEISIEQYNNMEGGYELIPVDIFSTYRKVISDKGWIIFCILTKMSSSNTKNIDKPSIKVSLKFLSNIINISQDTIIDYTNILEEAKLITISPRNNIPDKVDELGNITCKYISKIYTTPFKVDVTKINKS